MSGRRVFGKSAPSRLSRQMIGVALIVGLIPNAPLIALNQDENENAVVQPTVEATTRTPIPADSAPDEIKRLIKDGKVEVVYDSEPEFVKAGRGWADFHIQLKHTFRYSLTKLKKQGRWQVKLTVTRLDPHIELTHLVRLPIQFQSPEVWTTPLMRHEFDHVAISLDPRPRLLLRHLLEHLPVIERTLEANQKLSDELCGQWINEETDKRLTAVKELIRQNNLRLDKLSTHGNQKIPERAAFFAKLYTKENLAEMKFPFVEEVLGLLETPEYQQLEPRALPRDPAE